MEIQLWLEIGVRDGSSNGGYQGLAPRQKLTAAPYALHAEMVAIDAITGAEVANGTISAADLAADSVFAAEIAGNAVGAQGPFFGALFDPDTAFYTAQAVELLTDNTAYAAFSQAEWAFRDDWNLTLGLRYTWEERKLDRNAYDADPFDLSTGAMPTDLLGDGRFWEFPDGPQSFNPSHSHFLSSALQEDVSNDDWNPMGSIQYLFEDVGAIDVGSAYFTIATGFLSGGLSQLDSFDMKPQAPQEIRGEFSPISTQTPGVQVCEHLPRLAAHSETWSLVRSVTHRSNEQ